MISAVRGATTVDSDKKEQVIERVCELVDRVFRENGINDSDAVSIHFSITEDIVSINPAAALRRGGGYSSVPLFCAQEPRSNDSLPLAVRILVTWNNNTEADIIPSYLHGARILRPDLLS